MLKLKEWAAIVGSVIWAMAIHSYESSAGDETTQSEARTPQREAISNSMGMDPCRCFFKSKHYTWNHSFTPVEEQTVELYEFKHEGIFNPQTSSRFRCVYECHDLNGGVSMLDHVHYEIHPGYLNGGPAVAKLFNCPNAISGFKSHGTYYIPLPGLPFSPVQSGMRELEKWAQKARCQE